MTEYEHEVYWIWLQSVLGCGSHRTNMLLRRYSGAREIYELDEAERRESRNFTPDEIEKLRAAPIGKAQAVYERCRALGCRVVTPEDELYPERLRDIYAMPIVLYIKGDIAGLSKQFAISMVGTRNCTGYGLSAARMLAGQLARFGVVVVSGMALGIDTACHQSAMDHKGKTVAILGSGVDVPYPRDNEKMMARLCREHAVLTEYPPGTAPVGAHFPVRNRLIAGLSLGTVVVEGDERSGAMITASHALDQGKDVFAVPGRIDDRQSAGPLKLIKQGAKPVTCVGDILCEYEHLYPEQLRRLYQIEMEKYEDKQSKGKVQVEENPEPVRPRPEPPGELDETQHMVYERLGSAAQSVQELSAATGLSVPKLLPILTEMELMGAIENRSMNRYALPEGK